MEQFAMDLLNIRTQLRIALLLRATPQPTMLQIKPLAVR
jgi:hypothetical protein